MITRQRFCRLAALVILGVGLMSASHETASARGWNLDSRQMNYVTATLKPAKGVGEQDICPKHFRPMHLVKNIDLSRYSKLSVKAYAAENLLSTQADAARANKLVAVHMRIDITGCSFRQHFLPQNGVVTITGELGIGKLRETRLSFVQGGRDNSLEVKYTANLAGPDDTVPQPSYLGCCNTLTTWLDGRRVLGTLLLRPRENWVPIESFRLDGEAVHLDFWPPRLFVLAPDELN